MDIREKWLKSLIEFNLREYTKQQLAEHYAKLMMIVCLEEEE